VFKYSCILIFFCISIINACSVPVFRYAIENWNPDAYRVICFQKDPFNTNQKSLIEKISSCSAGKGNTCGLSVNCSAAFSVSVVNVADPVATAPFQALLKNNSTLPFPWVAVLFPKVSNIPVSLWTGELSKLPYKELFDSKARQDITKDLNEGRSAVWIILESGNKSKDNAAEKILKNGLQMSKDFIKLQEISTSDKERLLYSTEEVNLSFSLKRIARNDKNEHFFIQMLMSTERGMKQFENEPIAFPVFGRGRVLYSLAGKGINLNNILSANSFLSGPCACTVKEQNDGYDLLLCADWSKCDAAKKGTNQSIPSWSNLDAFTKEINAGGSPVCHIPENKN
jgi:hypothetical protein